MIRFAILILASLGVSFAGVRIGNESAVVTPASANYSAVLNVRPGNGELVSNNPPIFTWFYATNFLAGGEQSNPVLYQTNMFNFQIATQSDFGGTLVVNVMTENSCYNFLGPLSTNATRQFWWRVKYITNGVSYFTNGLYTFTIAGGAANWDRSMLADTNYLATNSAAHPMFCFRGGEEAAIWLWETGSQQTAVAAIRARAANATNQAYFKSHALWETNTAPNPTYAVPAVADYATRINDLGSVLHLLTFSGEDQWTNASMEGWLMTNLSHAVLHYNHPSNNWAAVDYGQPAGSSQYPRLVAATYDWRFNRLGTNTATFNGQLRTNALLGIKHTVRFWTHNNIWSAFATPPGNLIFMPNWGGYYTNNYDTWDYAAVAHCAPWHGWMKIGSSHTTTDSSIVEPLALLIPTDEDGALGLSWYGNYTIGRTSPYAGWAAHHIGPYGYVDNAISFQSVLQSFMIMDVAYPQVQFRNIEFLRRFPEWYTRLLPYGHRKYHGPYGDGAPIGAFGSFLGDARRGFDLAAVSRSGLARQAWDLNREFSNTLSDTSAQWDVLPLRYHYRNLPAPETNSTSAIYIEDGYVAASQISPSLFDCYTNGVGFSMKASPRGGAQGHAIPSSLAPDMWAYGAQITDGGGAGLDEYSSYAAASPGLYVNGLGEGDVGFALYGQSPTVPLQACLVNFTNSGTNFVYTCADGTAMFTNSYHPERGNVTKVKRHVLFVRSKYWVICDEFGSRSNSTFALRWHIPFAFRYEASGSALANETPFTLDRFGSNSLAMLGSTGFTYTAGNYADSGLPNPPRVPMTVMFGQTNGQIGFFNCTGTNSLGTGSASVNGTSATNSTLNPFVSGGRTYATPNPDRAVGMWITNRTPATNFTFVWVIVPQQPGHSAPAIQWADPFTPIVTYDGVTETNTFGTNYAGAFTYMVDMNTTANAGGGGEEGGGGSGTGTVGVQIIGRTATIGGVKTP